MRLIQTALLFLALSGAASAVPEPTAGPEVSKFSVSFELGGPGYYYTLWGSYRPIESLAVNVGLSVSAIVVVPVTASWLLFGPTHHLEISGGGEIVDPGALSIFGASTGIAPLFSVGYRYWEPGGGLDFRAAAYVLFGANVVVWPGISAGYTF
ncbi:hypothetical protein K2X33_07885 [bacterium]|nr:hypothetical protein [bacterium]